MSVTLTLRQPTPRLCLPIDSVGPLYIVFNNFYGWFACRTEGANRHAGPKAIPTNLSRPL